MKDGWQNFKRGQNDKRIPVNTKSIQMIKNNLHEISSIK